MRSVAIHLDSSQRLLSLSQRGGWLRAAVAASWGLAAWVCLGAPNAAADDVDFTRDIRPILSDNCFQCHGPDDVGRAAGLRLDLREAAVGGAGSPGAIVPGRPDESELLQRIVSDDPALRMPPEESGKSISPEEVELVRRWIEQDAPYSRHWAFVPPVRPATPELAEQVDARWRSNPIDAFVARGHAKAGLAASGRAGRETLLRRLHLDLIGLPPTLAEREAFLADQRPGAVERLIDRLLASPHYGEKWGRFWLDAARYADSDGYEKDKHRPNWFYRDWVIGALNRDMPYDQFIVHQIAGDLLPGAGQDELVATGFLRNSMVNEEGGADPEQFRVEGMFDRVDAIGKSILGITTQCAQCHSHKFDPLSQQEFFGLFAYLNNCYESFIIAYTPEEQAEIDSIKRRVAALEHDLQRATPAWRDEVAAWAAAQRVERSPWEVTRVEKENFTGEKFKFLDDASVLSQGFAGTQITGDFVTPVRPGEVTGVRVEFLMHPELPRGGPGRSVYGTHALTEFRCFHTAADGTRTKLKLAAASASIDPPSRPIGAPFADTRKGADPRLVGPVEYAIDEDLNTAWSAYLGPAERNQPHQAVFVLAEPIAIRQGDTLTFRLKQDHGGWNANDNQSNIAGRFRFAITDSDAPVADLLPAEVRRLVQLRPGSWSDQQWGRVFSYWRTLRPEWNAANQQIAALQAGRPEGVNQCVVREREDQRVTRLMKRGDFLKPGEEVQPHTPAFLNPAPEGDAPDRLAFARWMVDRRSPTTARSIVNRVWQSYFGIGLVETAEDLGSQAPWPSHPELLDWLAVEFMESGWRLKRLHRLIATSAAYQQSSAVTPEHLERDPRNRLLARGPRVRSDAEVVRDSALAASGLLNRAVGGPSVYPPAPASLFVPPASYGVKPWELSSDSQQHRRSLYVQSYRSTPYPVLQVFDAPNGAAACVRRVRSNTPLQALTMLNENQFVACSQALARRVVQQPGGADAERLRRAFLLVLSREPNAIERRLMEQRIDQWRDQVAGDGADPYEIIAADPRGGLPRDQAAELAAWTLAARALLNLDEAIVKH